MGNHSLTLETYGTDHIELPKATIRSGLLENYNFPDRYAELYQMEVRPSSHTVPLCTSKGCQLTVCNGNNGKFLN